MRLTWQMAMFTTWGNAYVTKSFTLWHLGLSTLFFACILICCAEEREKIKRNHKPTPAP